MGSKNMDLGLGRRVNTNSPVAEGIQNKEYDLEKRRQERIDEEEQAQHEAKMARLRQQEIEARKAVEATSSNPGFKIGGEIDLGSWNPQKQVEEERQRTEQILAQQGQRAEKLEQENKNLTNQLFTQSIESLTRSFEERSRGLEKLISEMGSTGKNDKTITDQLKELAQVAEMIGYKKQQAGQPQDGNLQVQVMLKKMDYDAQERQRQHEWDMEKWRADQKRLERKDEGDLAVRREENQIKARRDQIFAELPEKIGTAIGAAIVAASRENFTGGAVAGNYEAPGKQAAQKSEQYFDAGVGEAGEVSCPQCESEIAISPTSTRASCASCGFDVPVRRIPRQSNHVNESYESAEEPVSGY